jgi:hypothetical protein
VIPPGAGRLGRPLAPGSVAVPDLLPGQPVGYHTMREQLAAPVSRCQALVSALRQLRPLGPAPVIAGAFGFHQTTATRQRRLHLEPLRRRPPKPGLAWRTARPALPNYLEPGMASGRSCSCP